jgi:alpha-ketoglutarate-dependent taurine dioxygenase
LKDGVIRRKAIDSSALVRVAALSPERELPALIEPAVNGVALADWCASHRGDIERILHKGGGILFRGFQIGDPENLERVVQALSGETMEYSYRSTPRRRVAGKVYTSTEYPATHEIPLHNEMSYSRTWPAEIYFLCVQPAAAGGETPIADSRDVYRRLSRPLRERFERHGVLYVRNYGKNLDLGWPEVFQTTDRAVVESFCAEHGIQCEWMPNGGLRTRQACQSVLRHRVTGEMVWFNQAHLFHASAVPEDLRAALAEELDEAELPRNAYYGDGSPIGSAELTEIRAAYNSARLLFPWVAGDLLALDNVLTAHGRMPYSGSRSILVAMAGPRSASS